MRSQTALRVLSSTRRAAFSSCHPLRFASAARAFSASPANAGSPPSSSSGDSAPPTRRKTPTLLQDCFQREPTQHSRTLIWLHGLGDSYTGFASAMDALSLPECRLVIPNAPQIPITINRGAMMRAWYNIKDMNCRNDEDEAMIEHSGEMLRELIDHEVERLHGHSQGVVIGGFSQGGAMAIYAGLRYPKPLAAVICASGYVLKTAGFPEEIHEAQKSTPVLQFHGMRDEMVPFAWSDETFEMLRKASMSIDQSFEPSLEHGMSSGQLMGMREWIERHTTE